MPPQPNEAFVWTQEPWGLALRCSPLSAITDHLFTSANLRLVDDQREWSAVAERVGVAAGTLRLLTQVHGAEVAIVRAGSEAPGQRPAGDIIISDDPQVAIVVRVADCSPILLADRRQGVVGAVHAGWRGTAKGAARRGVEAMGETFGCRVEDLMAAIGPCLGPCCGEVGPEVVDEFRALGADERDRAEWFTSGINGRTYLDLWKANRDQLERAGLAASQIHLAALCTKTHSATFHSYRAQGKNAGRMAGVIRARG